MQKMTSFATTGYRAVLTFSLMAMALTGCATGSLTYNEGSTRVGYMNKSQTKSVGLYLAGSNLSSDTNNTIIKSKDAFSVRLLSAFICDFRESSNPLDSIAISNSVANPCSGGDGGQHTATRGEIAIVANVGERNESVGLTFDPSSVKNGRVIYYNQDVRETGQLINALNLPVYGPKSYDGNPFYMDWAILELDNSENAAARNLLKQLADIGSVALAPYTPVFELLNALGGALIDSNGDDLEMRSQLETDSNLDCSKLVNGHSCDQLAIRRMPLREGYYAFIRSENRSKDVPLDSVTPEGATALKGVTVCEDWGVLCHNGEPWRESTWLLVRVARENKDAAIAQDNAQTLAQLVGSLNANSLNSNIVLDEESIKFISEKLKLKKYLPDSETPETNKGDD